MGTRVALDFVVSKLGPDEPERTSVRGGLRSANCKLARSEQRVLTRIAERLVLGSTTYGPLDLSSDSRSFRSQEARRKSRTPSSTSPAPG